MSRTQLKGVGLVVNKAIYTAVYTATQVCMCCEGVWSIRNRLTICHSDMCSVHAKSRILIMFIGKVTWDFINYSRATPIMPPKGAKERRRVPKK